MRFLVQHLKIGQRNACHCPTPRHPSPGWYRGRWSSFATRASCCRSNRSSGNGNTARHRTPNSLVGKQIVVNGLQNDMIIPFLRSLKPGEKVTLDVAHREGEKLTLLELTEDQRERIRQ